MTMQKDTGAEPQPERGAAPGAADDGPLAIIAGAGSLPREVAAEVTARGGRAVVLPIRGFADADFSRFQTRPIDLLDPSGALRALTEVGARAVILIGTVHKPGAGAVLAGWQAVRHRDEIRAVIQGGDDNLLRGVVRFLEASGFPVLGVREVAPALMAASGCLTAIQASEVASNDVALGFKVLHAMGAADVGQGLVVAQRRILAVEAAEGTDAMIRRVALLRRRGFVGRLLRHGRPPVAERKGGVLVKAPKPGQDFRVDLPAIGPRTVRRAAQAGLEGIAIEAGGVLIVERAATLAEADRHGLFIMGVTS